MAFSEALAAVCTGRLASGRPAGVCHTTDDILPRWQAVYWQLDHAMWVYPLPHALVLADSAPAADFTERKSGCVCINPVSSLSSFNLLMLLLNSCSDFTAHALHGPKL